MNLSVAALHLFWTSGLQCKPILQNLKWKQTWSIDLSNIFKQTFLCERQLWGEKKRIMNDWSKWSVFFSEEQHSWYEMIFKDIYWWCINLYIMKNINTLTSTKCFSSLISNMRMTEWCFKKVNVSFTNLSQRKLEREEQRLRDVQSWKKTKVAHFTHITVHTHTHRVKKCDDKCSDTREAWHWAVSRNDLW